MRLVQRLGLGALLALLAAPLAAQRAQWLTFGHDPQRSGWTREETAFTPQSVPRLTLLWKAQLANQPRSLNGLTAPLIANVATPHGREAMVFVAGSSDHLFALAAATGKTVWQDDFVATQKAPDAGMWLCPNALNDTPVIDAARQRLFIIAADGRLHTVALADGTEIGKPFRFVPAYSKMWSLNYVDGTLYTSISQGCAGAVSGVAAVDPDAPGHPVTTFWSAPNGAGVWGRGGPSADFKGDILAATGDAGLDPQGGVLGDSVLRLQAKTLNRLDFYTPPNWAYLNKLDLDLATSTPVVFRWRDRVLTAGGGKEGVAYLLDTANLGSNDHHRAADVTPRLANASQTFEKFGIWGTMSSWQEPDGTVWLVIPTWGPPAPTAPAFPVRNGAAPDGSLMAFRVTADAAGQPRLTPAWISSDIAVPEPAAIAGGVVFVLANGENTQQVYNGDIHKLVGDRGTLPQQQAKLFALDAHDGRALWDSGTTIQDWTHFSGLAIGADEVVMVTHSGQVYAFGLGGAPQP